MNLHFLESSVPLAPHPHALPLKILSSADVVVPVSFLVIKRGSDDDGWTVDYYK